MVEHGPLFRSGFFHASLLETLSEATALQESMHGPEHLLHGTPGIHGLHCMLQCIVANVEMLLCETEHTTKQQGIHMTSLVRRTTCGTQCVAIVVPTLFLPGVYFNLVYNSYEPTQTGNHWNAIKHLPNF